MSVTTRAMSKLKGSSAVRLRSATMSAARIWWASVLSGSEVFVGMSSTGKIPIRKREPPMCLGPRRRMPPPLPLIAQPWEKACRHSARMEDLFLSIIAPDPHIETLCSHGVASS